MKYLSLCYPNCLQAYHSKSKCKLLPVHSMKAHGELELQFHVFLSSVLDGFQWSAVRTCHSTTGQRDFIGYLK